MKHTIPFLLHPVQNLFFISLFVVYLFFTNSAFAIETGDAPAGKQKSYSCQFCHAPQKGRHIQNYPNLAGQDPQYLFQAMKAYQNHSRTGPTADLMAAQLQRMNDKDLRDIAAFYTQLP
ncbi:c-type cytochrome [Vibrio mangrovi]|nr:c-type cytochrome [Vibrio mangrovi]MDW6004596.1 c-type cytochrome [Vibrio mangrovi]